jgi:enoyl-CoA hydratase/carnithine racemase
MLMIHKAWSLALGNSDDMMATASLLEKIDGTIVETYEAAASRRGKEPANFAELMAAETWLTGAEAIDIGLADSVADDSPKARAKWDLSAYDNAPKPEAATGGEIVMTIKVDATEAEEKIAELSARAGEIAEVFSIPPEAMNEIEQDRPNFAADMLLRPAA